LSIMAWRDHSAPRMSITLKDVRPDTSMQSTMGSFSLEVARGSETPRMDSIRLNDSSMMGTPETARNAENVIADFDEDPNGATDFKQTLLEENANQLVTDNAELLGNSINGPKDDSLPNIELDDVNMSNFDAIDVMNESGTTSTKRRKTEVLIDSTTMISREEMKRNEKAKNTREFISVPANISRNDLNSLHDRNLVPELENFLQQAYKEAQEKENESFAENNESIFNTSYNDDNLDIVVPDDMEELENPDLSLVNEFNEINKTQLQEEEQKEADNDSDLHYGELPASEAKKEAIKLKNRTSTALKILRSKMGDSDSISFSSLTNSVARGPVAATFFELLVLKSKGLIDLEQNESYGEILIKKTPLFNTAQI